MNITGWSDRDVQSRIGLSVRCFLLTISLLTPGAVGASKQPADSDQAGSGGTAAEGLAAVTLRVPRTAAGLDELVVRRWSRASIEPVGVTVESQPTDYLLRAVIDCATSARLVILGEGWIGQPILLSLDDCAAGVPIEVSPLPAGAVRGRLAVPRGEALPRVGTLAVARCPSGTEAGSVSIGEYPARFGADGSWSAELPSGCLDLTLAVPPFAPLRWTAVQAPQAEETRVRDAVLVRGAALSAWVLAAETGRTIAGAVVYLVPERDFAIAADAAYAGRTVDVERWQRTDIRGCVRFEAVPAGVYRLVTQAPPVMARAPGFSEEFALAEGEEVVVDELVLAEPASLRIEVAPVEGSTLADGELRAEAWPILSSQLLAHSGKVVDLDAQSAGVLDGLVPGSWQVFLTWLPNGATTSVLERREVFLAPGSSETIQFEVAASAFHGQVTFLGEPIPGSLTLRSDREEVDSVLPSAEADDQGMFLVAVPQQGRYTVQFAAADASLQTAVPRVRFEEPEDLVEVKLPEGRIEGFVVDQAGEPVQGASVGATGVPTGVPGPVALTAIATVTESDESGRFVLQALAEGTWTLAARKTMLESDPLVTELALHEYLPGIRLVLRQTVPIDVSIVSETGEPIRGATVTLAFPPSLPGGMPEGSFFQTDGAGHAEFRVRSALLDRIATLTAAAPGRPRTALRHRLTRQMQIVVPDASGRLELVPEDQWNVKDVSGFSVALVADDGAGVTLNSVMRMGEGASAALPLPGSERPIIIPDLAPGIWHLVRLTGPHSELVALLEGQGRQLPTLATFVIRGSGTTRVEVPAEE